MPENKISSDSSMDRTRSIFFELKMHFTLIVDIYK